MQRVRIFQSALTNVRYAAGYPLSLSEYHALSKGERDALHAKCQG